jgi:hypothetical protein
VQAGDGQEAVRVGQPGLVPGMPGNPVGGELTEIGDLRRRGLVLDSHWLSPSERGCRVKRGLGDLVVVGVLTAEQGPM